MPVLLPWCRDGNVSLANVEYFTCSINFVVRRTIEIGDYCVEVSIGGATLREVGNYHHGNNVVVSMLARVN